MEESSEEKASQDTGAVGDRPVSHHLPGIQRDLAFDLFESVNFPPGLGVAHSSTTDPQHFVSDRITELRQMCIKPPPNRTITKSDPIPFPPDWPGPFSANRLNKSKSVTSDSSSSQGDRSSSKKPPSILSRTMSFLRGKRSEPSITSPEGPSTSFQSSSRANPSLSVLVPSNRYRQSSLSSDITERESTLTLLPSNRCATPSAASTSSDMWAEETSTSNLIKGPGSSAKQQYK